MEAAAGARDRARRQRLRQRCLRWLELAPGVYSYESLGAPALGFAGAPRAVVWKTDTFSIFARGKDGAIYFETWTGSAWQPGQLEWTSLSSPQNAPARTDPVVVSWRDNRFDFYVVGSDDNLYAKAWDTDHWIPTQHDWYALSGPIGK